MKLFNLPGALCFLGSLTIPLISCTDFFSPVPEENRTAGTGVLASPPASLIRELEEHVLFSDFAKPFAKFCLPDTVWSRGFTLFAPENKTLGSGEFTVDEIRDHLVIGQVLTAGNLALLDSVVTLSGKLIRIRSRPGDTLGIRLNGVALTGLTATRPASEPEEENYTCLATEQSLFRIPGAVVTYSAPVTQRYLGNPGFCVLPNGYYLASHDFFGPGATTGVSRIFRSKDKGRSWHQLSEIHGAQVSDFFYLNGQLYLMGLDKPGNVVIRKSADEGLTWTSPTTGLNGLILSGLYQTASSPAVVHNGRVWKAVEKLIGSGDLYKRFNAQMLSAPVGSDLLTAANWTASSPLIGYSASDLPGNNYGGVLEGSAVIGPSGQMLNVLRVHTTRAGYEYGALVGITPAGDSAVFDPTQDFIRFPGGSKKFVIRKDSHSGRYWTLANGISPEFVTVPATTYVRNTLYLCSSADLRNWSVHKMVLDHPDRNFHGFQYVNWDFEGGDILFLSRTSFDDGRGTPHSFHDANYLTFHRITNFRQYQHRNYPYPGQL